MFEKWTKKFAEKATDSAINGAAQSLNDRIGKYGDIIQIGLVLGVIILGSSHIAGRNRQERHRNQSYIPAYLPPAGSGQPVIVNNYYREREDNFYEQRRKQQQHQYFIRDGQVQNQPIQTRKTYPKR